MDKLTHDLAEALKRLLAWSGPISGDNRNFLAAKEEDESVEQALAVIAEYNRQLEREQMDKQ